MAGSGLAQKVRNISRERICFQVDGVVLAEVAEVRARQRVRHEHHRKLIARGGVDSERDAVEGDGSFFGDEFREAGLVLEAEFAVRVAVGDFRDGGGGVDVSCDDVSADFVAEAGGAFKVDFLGGLGAGEGGAGDGFGREVEGEGGGVVIDGGILCEGEAASVGGDGGAGVEVVCEVGGCGDIDLALADGGEFADVGDDACEHFFIIL